MGRTFEITLSLTQRALTWRFHFGIPRVSLPLLGRPEQGQGMQQMQRFVVAAQSPNGGDIWI